MISCGGKKLEEKLFHQENFQYYWQKDLERNVQLTNFGIKSATYKLFSSES